MRARSVLTVVIAAALAAATPAFGAFPGKNGLIAFQKIKSPSSEIYVMGPKGGKERDVTRTPRVSETAPAFSPDGRFVIWTNEATHDIWIAKSDGSGARNLTHQPGFEKDPTWGRVPKRH